MKGDTEIKIRGYHVDMYGHVNNARYLEFLEEARWEKVEGTPAFEYIQENGLAFFVVNININYRRPASPGDIVEVKTQTKKISKSSGVLSQIVFLKDTETVVADADVTFVIADARTGRAVPIKGELKERFELLNQ